MDREPLRDTNLQLRASSSSFPDENSCGASGFHDLAQAFSQRITELQQVMCLRIEGSYQAQWSTERRSSMICCCARRAPPT
jgi:hypothetical protein